MAEEDGVKEEDEPNFIVNSPLWILEIRDQSVPSHAATCRHPTHHMPPLVKLSWQVVKATWQYVPEALAKIRSEACVRRCLRLLGAAYDCR